MSRRKIVTRSISPENRSGAKGMACRTAEGIPAEAGSELDMKRAAWVSVAPGETLTLADIRGPGEVTTIWLTAPHFMGDSFVLRVHYDEESDPSVEVPLLDFFCDGWLARPVIDSRRIALLPANGYTSFWNMPFRRRIRITLENIGSKTDRVYWQVDFVATKVPRNKQYFHATWRRRNPLGEPVDFTVVDGVRGQGKYVGMYLGLQPNWDGWCGEGEVKIYLDGDDTFPTIAYTGTEDYFLGAWNHEKDGRQVPYSARDAGFNITPSNVMYKGYQRLEWYRWHPKKRAIRFDRNLKVTVQAIGAAHKFVPLHDADIFATSYWYMRRPGWQRLRRWLGIDPGYSSQPSLASQAADLGHSSLADYVRIEPQ